jgi:hypothetical protein
VSTASNSTGGVNFAVVDRRKQHLRHASGEHVDGHLGGGRRANNDTVTRRLVKTALLGRNTYVWLEFSVATGTTTWLGAGGVTYVQSGISGSHRRVTDDFAGAEP